MGVMEPGALIGPEGPSGQLVIGSLDDPIWKPLPSESANPVRVARRYVASLLAEVAKIDGDHFGRHNVRNAVRRKVRARSYTPSSA